MSKAGASAVVQNSGILSIAAAKLCSTNAMSTISEPPRLIFVEFQTDQLFIVDAR